MQCPQYQEIKSFQDVEQAYRMLADELIRLNEAITLKADNIAQASAEVSADGTEVDIVSDPIIVVSGPVLVSFSCSFRGFGYIRLYRDATKIYESTVNGWLGSSGVYTPLSILYQDTPAAGTYTYKASFIRYDATFATCWVKNACLALAEMRT